MILKEFAVIYPMYVGQKIVLGCEIAHLGMSIYSSTRQLQIRITAA
jgi:hypothetical protein